jgi:hypothetical protein
VHVAGQGGEGGKVQCLWSGCKVYGALSSSATWLTSHVTGHIGSKPFRCIVDACRQRFASQVGKSGTKFKTFAKCYLKLRQWILFGIKILDFL